MIPRVAVGSRGKHASTALAKYDIATEVRIFPGFGDAQNHGHRPVLAILAFPSDEFAARQTDQCFLTPLAS